MTEKRALFLLAFLWVPHIVTIGARAQSQGSPAVIGETVRIQSSVLKESSSLLVSKPAGYERATDRYPVLYLLDGEAHFHYTSGIIGFLAENDRIPKMLLVGVVSGGFARRTHDLTPPSVAEIDNRFSPGNGGADAFLSFIADELIPYVDRTYRTRPYKLLVGHSFGGIAPSTWEDYRYHIEKNIVPAMGSVRLDELEPRIVDAFLKTLRAKGHASRTIEYALAVLRRPLQFAVDWRFITANPASSRMRAAKRRKARENPIMCFLNPEQAKRPPAVARLRSRR